MPHRFVIPLIATLGHLALLLLAKTWRVKARGHERAWQEQSSGKPQLWITWHGRLIVPTWHSRRRNIATMISRSSDGELVARVVQKLGYTTARGSSSRGGTAAALELLDEIKRGRTAAMICDGPRGPIYKMKPGIAFLAVQTGATVTPVISSANRAWVFKSWDRFQLPKPFAKVFVFYGDPIIVSHEADLKATTRLLENALNALLAEAEFCAQH